MEKLKNAKSYLRALVISELSYIKQGLILRLFIKLKFIRRFIIGERGPHDLYLFIYGKLNKVYYQNGFYTYNYKFMDLKHVLELSDLYYNSISFEINKIRTPSGKFKRLIQYLFKTNKSGHFKIIDWNPVDYSFELKYDFSYSYNDSIGAKEFLEKFHSNLLKSPIYRKVNL